MRIGVMTESTSNIPGRIFMSYRREDADYPAAWLFAELVSHFSRDQVFKDVDSIDLGDDFVEVITNAVGSCDVLLALIGRRWLTITGQDGRRRLDNPDDFVRLEIEAALTRNVRVIPILVEAAQMPRAGELPASLAKLARRQALELSSNRFTLDTQRLLKTLDRTLAEAQEPGRQETERPGRSQRQVERPAEIDSAPPGVSSAATPRRIASDEAHANFGDVQTTAGEISQDGLLSADDTVVVAARAAWPEYQLLSAYVCQPNRSFRAGLKYFGFYAEGAIQPLIPHIRKHYTAVLFTRGEASARRAYGETELASLIEYLLDQDSRTDGEAYDVLLLTSADDPKTVRLEAPIANDTVTESGKPWGWTLSQRYTRLDKLTSGVTRTSQL